METLGEVRRTAGTSPWRMGTEGLVSAIVTQNVDGLHQAAGSKAVHELHGRSVWSGASPAAESSLRSCFPRKRPADSAAGNSRPGGALRRNAPRENSGRSHGPRFLLFALSRPRLFPCSLPRQPSSRKGKTARGMALYLEQHPHPSGFHRRRRYPEFHRRRSGKDRRHCFERITDSLHSLFDQKTPLICIQLTFPIMS